MSAPIKRERRVERERCCGVCGRIGSRNFIRNYRLTPKKRPFKWRCKSTTVCEKRFFKKMWQQVERGF